VRTVSGGVLAAESLAPAEGHPEGRAALAASNSGTLPSAGWQGDEQDGRRFGRATIEGVWPSSRSPDRPPRHHPTLMSSRRPSGRSSRRRAG